MRSFESTLVSRLVRRYVAATVHALIRTRPRRRTSRGQTLVEFALVLPLVLLLMVMIAEFGWFVALSSASGSAAREGGRYASSVGTISGTSRYVHCSGIRGAARNSTDMVTTLTDAQIEIRYYQSGTTTPTTGSCAPLGSGPIASEVARFDQVEITVRVPYQAMTPIGAVFLGTRDLVSTDIRTIAKAP